MYPGTWAEDARTCSACTPKVTDIAVIGLPDEEMGERVVGVVQFATG